MRVLMIMALITMVCGCQSPEAPKSNTDQGTFVFEPAVVNTPTNKSFGIQLSKAGIAMDLSLTSGGFNLADLANGLMGLGDTNNEPKRGIITFPISSLQGAAIVSAYLNLYYESDGATNEISALGALRVYRIHGVANPSTANYSATELSTATLFTSASQYAVAQHTKFQVNIADMLQDAIQEGESYLTVKVRFDTTLSAGHNNGISFYANYTSSILDAYKPQISGQYY